MHHADPIPPTVFGLNTNTGAVVQLENHLRSVHQAIAAHYPSIARIALATYNPATDRLTALASSNAADSRNADLQSMVHYEATLADVPTLQAIADSRTPRVVHDIDTAFTAPTEHTLWLKAQHYRSSLTVPIFKGDTLCAFLFFDALEPHIFDPDTTTFLNLFAQLVAQNYLLQLQVTQGVIGSIHLASGLARIRDLETGHHLDRMAAYARLMAEQLARERPISEEFIAHIFLFAPLHDVGKVGIPDHVLLKPGSLDAEEWAVMRRHVEIGESIAAQIAADLGIGDENGLSVMRNIVAQHHERGDGSGYPRGLTMDQISLEGRIVAVADVYDALSTYRPYKRPWTREAIENELRGEAEHGLLDADCVRVLLDAAPQRAAIAQRFKDLNAA